MQLEDVLRRIHSGSTNLVHGRSPLSEISNGPQSGTIDAAGGRPHQQQMRWSRQDVDLLLQACCGIYNGTFGFTHGQKFRLANDPSPPMAIAA
jgi:hypothetical protein